MAPYTITHCCGHDAVHDRCGPDLECALRIDWLRRQPCADCDNDDLWVGPLPPTLRHETFLGSRADVATAARIRYALRLELDRWADACRNAPVHDHSVITTASLTGHAEASWWIDRRHRNPYDLIAVTHARRPLPNHRWAPLTGLPRFLQWANRLRVDLLAEAHGFRDIALADLARDHLHRELSDAAYAQRQQDLASQVAWIETHTVADWWIDRRRWEGDQLLAEAERA